MLYYAKSSGGFYDTIIHGERTLTVVDSSWVRPTKKVPDPNWVAPLDEPEATAPLIEVPDMAVAGPTVTVPNPACQIPADAVEVTADEHQALLSAQAAGKAITADSNGAPIAVDPASLLTLAQAQAQRAASVSAACAAALVGGFASSALGSVHTYPSQDNDQRNLLNAAMASQGQPSTWTVSLWCANGTTWALTAHTAAQVQQVNADWLAFRLAAQQKCADLVAKINAATSISSVETFTW